MELIGFVILSAAALISALVVVFHRNPVVCALALAGNLISIAGFYLLLHAQFLALLQIIVYAGAIMVLILFVVMLLNLPDELQRPGSGMFQKSLAPIFAVAFALILGMTIAASMPRGPFDAKVAGYGTIGSVGLDLFGNFFYPFEAISLLLIVAMIGAVLLAKRRL